MEIRRLGSREEAQICAQIMSSSEPWITLQRDYTDSLQFLENPDLETYVALDGNQVLGFATLNLKGDFVGYLKILCVAPESRGAGIGSALVRFAEERIFRDYPNVFIMCSSFNPRACALYERLGFQYIGELKDYVVRGHSEILLRKTRCPIREFSPR
jgi:[ribosomal protein S18]-alanine N-acetyltransferase